MGMVRVALAMAVVLSHLPLASYKFMGGGLAVQCFFIVSGFYMALVLDGKYRDVGLFYSNRLLRLFPIYFVMMALTAIVVIAFDASATATQDVFATIAQNPGTALLLAFQNLTLLGQDMLFWFTLDESGALVLDTAGAVPNEEGTLVLAWQGLLVPQSWSLSMELLFYAVAPFIARLHWRWIVAIALASLALRLSGRWIEGMDYLLWQGRFFPTALFLFLLGMLAHRALPFAARLPKAVGWILCAAMLVFVAIFPLFQFDSMGGRWIAYAAIAATTPFIFTAFKDFAWDRWVGDLSYPIYMTQLFVIGAVLTYPPPHGLWVALLGTLALSVLLLILVDRPVDRWRQRRAESASARRTGAASAAAPASP